MKLLAKGRQIVLPVVYNGQELELTAKMVSAAAQVGNKKAISPFASMRMGRFLLQKFLNLI